MAQTGKPIITWNCRFPENERQWIGTKSSNIEKILTCRIRPI